MMRLQLPIKHAIFGSMFVGVLISADDIVIGEGEAWSSGPAREAWIQVPRVINVIFRVVETGF